MVVIIIGVLSAVVLPKFNKIVETRKTTEAEELMSAVRTEQEKRCALDKEYLTEVTKLTEVLPTDTTKNFAYTLTSTGIKAASKGKYSYELQMPSCADGRICCENETECLKLNKDYPLCSELLAKADYDDGTACAGTTTPAVPPVIQCPGSATEKCGCNNAGERTRTCNTSTGEWSEWSACPVADECECTGTKPATSQTCNSCGTQTRTVTCNTSTGEWSAGSWSTCSKTTAECSCKATPKYESYNDYFGGETSGGNESFIQGIAIEYISGYECKDGAGNACDGCKIPSCSDPSFFNAHKQTCCKTEMKSHPSCCTTAVNVQEACGYVPQGQQCNKFTWACVNIAGDTCVGCNYPSFELADDEEPLPDDYEPTPGEGLSFPDLSENFEINDDLRADKDAILNSDLPKIQL